MKTLGHFSRLRSPRMPAGSHWCENQGHGCLNKLHTHCLWRRWGGTKKIHIHITCRGRRWNRVRIMALCRLVANIREAFYYYTANCVVPECFCWRREVWLPDPPQGRCFVGPDMRDRTFTCQTQRVCLCLCAYMSDLELEGGAVWDKELLGFLHLFSHSIGVRAPLPGLQSPGLMLWCQHEFAQQPAEEKTTITKSVFIQRWSSACSH